MTLPESFSGSGDASADERWGGDAEQGYDDEELIDLVVEFLRDIQAKL
jgi:hypothetical protein